jgi:hypothetical protein
MSKSCINFKLSGGFPQPAYWSLDLSNTGTLRGTEKALAASCLLIDATTGRRTRTAQLWSPQAIVPLDALPPLKGIEFLPVDETVRLPLGIEKMTPADGSTPAIAFLFASRDFRLKTGWKNSAAGPCVLQSLQIAARVPNDVFKIECFSTPTKTGAPLTVHVRACAEAIYDHRSGCHPLALGRRQVFDRSNAQAAARTASVVGHV